MSKIWEAWKRFGQKVGDFQARVILTLVYFLIVGPFALVVRIASDPLRIKAGHGGGWNLKPEAEGSPIERAVKQF